MSSLDTRLNDIAAKAARQELPHGVLTRSSESMIPDFRSESVVLPQQTEIDEAVRSFAAMTRLIMPGDAIHSYVKEVCTNGQLPPAVRANSSALAVPTWAEPGDFTFYDENGSLDRTRSAEKFTREEIERALFIAQQCPDLPVCFLYLQAIIESYCTDIREKIGEISPERAASLDVFEKHWSGATNLLRFMFTAMTLHLPQDVDANAIDEVRQDTVTAAFHFLAEHQTFDLNLALSDIGLTDIRFSCPARPLLADMLVENGTFMLVVEKVRELRAGHARNSLEGRIHLASTEWMKATSDLAAEMCALHGKQGLRRVQDMFSVREQRKKRQGG